MTAAQYEQLAKRVPRESRADQWFDVFDILFPGHQPRPTSPFKSTEIGDEVQSYQDFSDAILPNLILPLLTSDDTLIDLLASDLQQRCEMVRTILQGGARMLVNSWSCRAMAHLTAPTYPAMDTGLLSDTQFSPPLEIQTKDEHHQADPIECDGGRGFDYEIESSLLQALTEQQGEMYDDEEHKSRASCVILNEAGVVAEQSGIGNWGTPEDGNSEQFEEWQSNTQYDDMPPNNDFSEQEPFM